MDLFDGRLEQPPHQRMRAGLVTPGDRSSSRSLEKGGSTPFVSGRGSRRRDLGWRFSRISGGAVTKRRPLSFRLAAANPKAERLVTTRSSFLTPTVLSVYGPVFRDFVMLKWAMCTRAATQCWLTSTTKP